MDRMSQAIHEAGHLIICYYQKIEITSIKLDGIGFVFPPRPQDVPDPWDLPGYEGRYYPPVSYEEKLKKWWYGLLHLMAAGFLCEFMYLGDELFWKSNPKSEIMTTSDMTKLGELDGNKAMQKGTKQSLYGISGFLSNPPIWGKIMALSDEILDNNKELTKKDDVFEQVYKSLIMKTDRRRKPIYEASPLIEFIITELYRN